MNTPIPNPAPYAGPLVPNHTPFPTHVAHHALAYTGLPIWPALIIGAAVAALGLILLITDIRARRSRRA